MEDRKLIILVILILVIAFFSVIMIIVSAIRKNLATFKNSQIYIYEQKDFVQVIKVEKLEIYQKFYSYTYKYLVTFKSIDTAKIYDLYVQEYEASDFLIGDEYHISHDGEVLLDLKKSLFS